MTTTKLRPQLILAICCLSLLLVSLDVTIVNVALPAIRRDLRTTTAGLEWVIDAYTLVLASLLMLSGSLADRFGRRRVFELGLSLFVAASALCSLAPNLGVLIVFRMAQAVGASMLNPVAMSIITNVFVEPKARARAIGVWGAVAGLSMALGPLVGGALTQAVGWRAIFWVNVPSGVAALVLARLFVPESRAARPRRPDPVGQLLMFCALAAVTYAIIEGPRLGWSSPLTGGLFAFAAFATAALLAYEPRREEPLLDLRFFRSVPFSSATLVAVLAFGTFSGFLFLNALYLQEVRRLPAFRTGLYTLPLALAAAVCSPISGWLVGRSGTRTPLLLAGSGFAASAFMLGGLDAQTPLARVLAAYVVFGIGFGLVNAPITNTAVSGMPRARAGLAAAVASTSRQVGASLGVAIGGTIAQGRRGAPTELTAGMHAFFGLAVAAGLCIIALGMLSSSAWGRESLRRTATLIEEGDRPSAGGGS